MMDNDALQLYLNRVRPVYVQLFNLAHAITGSCDRAEYALQYALTDYWASGSASGMPSDALSAISATSTMSSSGC